MSNKLIGAHGYLSTHIHSDTLSYALTYCWTVLAFPLRIDTPCFPRKKYKVPKKKLDPVHSPWPYTTYSILLGPMSSSGTQN